MGFSAQFPAKKGPGNLTPNFNGFRPDFNWILAGFHGNVVKIWLKAAWPLPCPSFLKRKSLFFLLARISWSFFSIFLSFSRDFRGSAGIKILYILWSFPRLFLKKNKGKEGQGSSADPIYVRYFRNPCDGDPPTGNFKTFKFLKNSL